MSPFSVALATDLAYAALTADRDEPKRNMDYTISSANPYAPEWMTGIFRSPCTPPGFQDKHRVYSKTLPAMATGTSLFNQVMPIDGRSDFIGWEFAFFPVLPLAGIAYGDIQVRFRDGAGNRLSQDWLNPQDIEGPIFPQLVLLAGSNFMIDIKNVNAGSVTFQVMIRGFARYKL